VEWWIADELECRVFHQSINPPIQTGRNELLFLAVVGDELEPRARDALELSKAFRAGKVVTDAEGVTPEFVDRRGSLVLVRSFGAGNGHALGLAGGIERVSALVGVASDEDLMLAVVEFEADAL
jgi:hypothetical protein